MIEFSLGSDGDASLVIFLLLSRLRSGSEKHDLSFAHERKLRDCIERRCQQLDVVDTARIHVCGARPQLKVLCATGLLCQVCAGESGIMHVRSPNP